MQGNLKSVYSQVPLTVVVIGASGDLSMRKIFPAFYALYVQKHLPHKFYIVGFARTPLNTDSFREQIGLWLEKEVRNISLKERDDFIGNCYYCQGNYNNIDDYNRLGKLIEELEKNEKSNKIYYMAIPPFLFLTVSNSLHLSNLSNDSGGQTWTRVVVEKPFGRDRESSDELTVGLQRVFREDQIYRIDHYLAKEVIQNLMVLRFANLILEPIWNRQYVDNIRISWMEDLGVEGRGGYFDEYGIIRDVMQNHLLQMVALIAMEQPIRYEADYIRDEKVKILRCITPVSLSHLVIGQYGPGIHKGEQKVGYREEEGISLSSITPTYSAVVLFVKNRRWDGVPFLLRAGKGLSKKMTEIKVQFKDVPANIFSEIVPHMSPNELVIRVQPEAMIALKIVNKVPGLTLSLRESYLDLSYESAFETRVPEAYELLLLDVIRGDRSLFIRSDELESAWDIFTPVLHELENKRIQPTIYPFGSDGPASADLLASRFGTTW
ncbi:MAG: glucose-6-phosphate dehydrogenase [Candidatus Hydrogenedentes bacterium]|nr:glucose-6-phosphate dehydrogenase [Candidatus Hydrogenedentota bacterium]